MEKCWPFVLCELKNADLVGGILNINTSSPQIALACGDKILTDCLSHNGNTLRRSLAHMTIEYDSKQHVDKAFLLGGDHVFGHMVSCFIMRTIYLKLFPHLDDLPVITMANMPQKYYELLHIFGCPRERLIMLSEADILSCDHLHVPTIAGGVSPFEGSWSVPGKLTRLYRETVLAAFGETSKAKPTRAAYILRGNAKTRRVLNDKEVIEFFTDRGYDILDPGAMSLVDQVRAAQATKYYVTPTGSQQHIADFAQPRSQLVMLATADQVVQRTFTSMQRWLDLEIPFGTLICESDKQANIYID